MRQSDCNCGNALPIALIRGTADVFECFARECSQLLLCVGIIFGHIMHDYIVVNALGLLASYYRVDIVFAKRIAYSRSFCF